MGVIGLGLFGVMFMLAVPQIFAAFFGGGVGLFVKDGRLVYPARWSAIHLDQIVVMSLTTDGAPFYAKPNTIRIELANGKIWKVNALPFRTPIEEMIAGIEAHAPRLAKRGDAGHDGVSGSG
jgi:hypothetical protein